MTYINELMWSKYHISHISQLYLVNVEFFRFIYTKMALEGLFISYVQTPAPPAHRNSAKVVKQDLPLFLSKIPLILITLYQLSLNFKVSLSISRFLSGPFRQKHPLIPSNFIKLISFMTGSGQVVAFFMKINISCDCLNISDYM